jgi:hypothetical protein
MVSDRMKLLAGVLILGAAALVVNVPAALADTATMPVVALFEAFALLIDALAGGLLEVVPW